MIKRTTISAERLRLLLEAEFASLRAPECGGCSMAALIPSSRTDFISANWRIAIPPECPHGCHERILEAAARLWTRHDLPEAYVSEHAAVPLRKRPRPAAVSCEAAGAGSSAA